MKNILEVKLQQIDDIRAKINKLEEELSDILGIEGGTDFRAIDKVNKAGVPFPF
jgi:hypothetical protein